MVVVDDDPVIREMVRNLAEALGAEVLAEADNGRSAIEEAERHHPAVMLLDVSMPIMGGLPTARYLHDHLPDLIIIFVSQYRWKVYVEEALQCGAKGYVVKNRLATELEPAIEAVLHGETFVSSRVQ